MVIDTTNVVSLDILSDLYILPSVSKDIGCKITVKQSIYKDIEASVTVERNMVRSAVNVLSINGGTEFSNLVFVQIDQLYPNQTVHVYTPQKEGGEDHTSSFSTQIGTTGEIEVIADEGYTPGEPIIQRVNRDDRKVFRDINASVSIYYTKSMDVECDCTVEIERRKSYVWFL